MSTFIVGTDVGQNSVGLATIEVDENNFPVSIPNLLVVLHDSGKDGMASGQTASVSRKASGGAARRVRRLLRNRRRRALKLEQGLAERGYPVPPRDSPTTYGPWEARSELLAGPIESDQRRREMLSLAIRHMSNHRGWANAWVSLESYWNEEEPSKEFQTAVEVAREKAGLGGEFLSEPRFQADLARYGWSNEFQLRPRKNADPDRPHLLGTQRRVDVVREWREICSVQGLPREEFEFFAKRAFAQEKPKVPIERVGNDWLPGFENKKRASVSSLEHQEFKIRQVVANLAVRPSPRSRERERLTAEQQNLIVDHLMSVTSKDEQPRWQDVAESFLGIEPNLLVHFEPEEQLGGLAPINNSVLQVHSLPAKHPVRQWWIEAAPASRRSFLLNFADPAETEIPEEIAAQLESIVMDLNEKELDSFLKLKFASGRSAHSLEALEMLNREIELSGDPYVTVRNRLFGEATNKGPTAENLDAQSDHPTLQRIIPIIRRYLLGLERQGKKPSRVVIEHVRDAFLGFQAKQEASLEMIRNRKSREVAKQDIANSGYITNAENADDGMIRKFQAFRRQNSECLYCGATPGWTGMEMDHIVPRASGGNSTRANLVAVCRDCNAAKGKLPFAQFAASGKRPGVSLSDAIERVRSYLQFELDRKQLERLKKETIRRLKQTEEDEPIDERALASTAYAAVEVRRRVMESLELPSQDVPVYSGKIVSAARHSSGVDKIIALREGIDVKTRFDRRHHAIDAAVVAMMNPSVARTLAERDDLRNAERALGEQTGWREYEGSTPAAREKFSQWKASMKRLSELIREKVEADEVVVMQPVRYSAHHAALHLDGKSPHVRKRLGEAWTGEERARIVDDKVYEAVSGTTRPSDSQPEDATRSIVLPNGQKLEASGDIYLFPSLAARQPLPNAASAELGPTMHHVRLFRWPDKKDGWKAGIIRVWASDLYDLEGGVGADVLTAPLLASSRAVRRANGTRDGVRNAIHEGVAEHVGTFVIGDEIIIDPREWVGSSEPARFLGEFPESHWKLLGAMSDLQFTLGPIHLSREGILERDDDPTASKRVKVSPLAKKVIGDRMLITASTLWRTRATRVVRRTALGSERLSGTSGMPSSWTPYEAVYGS